MPQSRSIAFGSSPNKAKRSRERRPEGGSPPRPAKAPNRSIELKTKLIKAFSDAWEKKYGSRYLPSDIDGKTVYFSVIPMIDEDEEDSFIATWEEAIDNALSCNLVWEDGEADEAGDRKSVV